MAYGTVKVDNITFTNAGIDQTITVSGIVASISGNITATGTIQGANIIGTTLVSGATVTGNSASFTTITGGTVTLTSGVFASGTAAAPSVSIGTTDNGLYSPGADQVAISSNGTGRLFVRSDGTVVATTALSVSDVSSNDRLQLIYGTSDGSILGHRIAATGVDLNYITRLGQNGSHIFSTNNAGVTAERLRITSDGKLGLGTSSPSDPLHVIGQIRADYAGTKIVTLYPGNAANTPAIGFTSGESLRFVGTSEYGRWDSSGRFLVGTSSTSSASRVVVQGNSLSEVGVVRIGTSLSTPGDGVNLGQILFTDSSHLAAAGITATRDGGTWTSGSSEPGRLVFSTTADGSASPTERMRIDSAGQIQIAGSGTAAAPAVVVGGDVNTGLYSPGADQVAISTNGTGRLFIDASGNVGVGTSPGAVLDVNVGSSRQARFAYNSANGSVEIYGSQSSGFNRGLAIGGEYIVFNSGSNAATTRSEAARITADGKLGLGTSSPAEKLHIEGSGRQSLRIRNTAPGSTASPELTTIDFYGNTQPRVRIEAQDRSTSANGGWLAFSTANSSNALTTALTIDNSQRVGIGTMSPTTPLHVNAPTSNDIFRLSRSDANGYLTVNFSSQNTNFNSNSQYIFNQAGTELARIDSSGRLLVGTSSALAVGGTQHVVQSESIPGATAPHNASFIRHGGTLAGAGAVLSLARSRGTTAGSVTAVAANDSLGVLVFYGSNGTDFSNTAGAIACEVDGTPFSSGDTTDLPGRLVFSTTADGSASPTERMRLDSSGRLGLGTSSPSANLEVKSGGNATVNIFGGSTSNDGIINFGDSSARSGIVGSYGTGGGGTLSFYTDTTGGSAVTRLSIDNAGNINMDGGTVYVDAVNNRLGIGTTAPTSTLSFGATDAVISSDTSDGSDTKSISIAGGGGLAQTRGGFAQFYGNEYSGYAGNVIISTGDVADSQLTLSGRNSSSVIRFNTGGSTERMRLDSSGRLGLGTSSPGSLLSLAASNATPPAISIQNTTSGTGDTASISFSMSSVAGASGALIRVERLGSNAQSELSFWTGNAAGANTRALTIDQSQRVLIGTSTNLDSFSLQVDSSVNTVASFTRYTSDAAVVRIGSSRGTQGSRTALNNDDIAGVVRFDGYTGSAFSQLASISGVCDGQGPAANDSPGRLVFSTTADGAASPTERMRIDSTGRLLVNLTSSVNSGALGGNANYKLEVGGVSDGAAITLAGTSTVAGGNGLMGGIEFRSFAGSTWGTAGSIVCRADGSQSSTSKLAYLAFRTTASGSNSDTERMRITSDAYVRLASGTGGIQFNGDTAAANALDDYEEGTFTPAIQGGTTAGTGTYSFRSGNYSKVGNIVLARLTIAWSGHTGTGEMRFTGLPFTATQPGTGSAYINNVTLTANTVPVPYWEAWNYFVLRQNTVGGGAGGGVAQMDAAGDMNATIVYLAS